MGLTRFYLVLLGFYVILLGFTGFYWVLLRFTGVLLGLLSETMGQGNQNGAAGHGRKVTSFLDKKRPAG